MPAPPPPNDSSTGGYLAPYGAAPSYDTAFDLLIQSAVCGITSLPKNFVRPRWQEVPPLQPERGVDWCAIGIAQSEPFATAIIVHRGAGDGHDDVYRTERVTYTASFYGPNAIGNLALLRDGFSISQNRAILKSCDIAVFDVGTIRSAPELVNDRWLNRADMAIRFDRTVGRAYRILNLLSAQGVIIGQYGNMDGATSFGETNWQAPEAVGDENDQGP